jgi:hypothetical protein
MGQEEVRARADRLSQLLVNDSYQELRGLVYNAQVGVFTNPRSTLEVREEAHAILRALDAMDRQITKAVGEAKIIDRKAVRDQDRGDRD